ncbi:MAG: phosphoribosylglycinamide formyltransferase [Bacteroidetes bacterium]|nr:phosphoribosylglycinamide formyltransferase [Bacteroidota bacterium]MBS1757621.1 phosphoribosylglycinamide formyltransferase [Bacteroidota bacterium]
MEGLKNKKIRVAIFASGAGSNAEKIMATFKNHAYIEVCLVICNKPQAGVLEIAQKNYVPVLLINKVDFFSDKSCLNELKQQEISWIILAGFLWKIPTALTQAFAGKMVNIHPALLPKYGGKGMYGHHVHEAVILNKEKESGITIHYVDEIYDHGSIILQKKCSVSDTDNADSLANKIHKLEHEWYAKTIEEIILKAKA